MNHAAGAFMIFFSDSVTTQMSEGCWLFALKMTAVLYSGKRHSTFRGFQPNVDNAFLRGDKIRKENPKKHGLHDSFKFYYPMLAEEYSQQNLRSFLYFSHLSVD